MTSDPSSTGAGSRLSPSLCSSRALREEPVWGHRSHREGGSPGSRQDLGEVCTSHCSSTGSEHSPRGLPGERCPSGCWQHTGPAQLHRAQRPLSALVLGRKGQGVCVRAPSAALEEAEHLPVGQTGSRIRTTQPSCSVPSPGSSSPCRAVPCKSRTWLHGLGRRRGARRREQHSPFSPAPPRNFFVRSRGWRIPVQSSSRTAAIAAVPSHPGRISAPRHRGSSGDRVLVVTRVQGAGLCLEEPGRKRCMCRATPDTSTVMDTSSPGHHTGFI